jgi:pyridoxamine 5'-phosphate oxidase
MGAIVRRADLDPDPFRQFDAWFAEARAAGVPVPETMTVATATPDGRPSARQVLLKGVDARGFVFFTGYGSRKGSELEANPRAALLLHWAPLGRQVRVEGTVARVPREESEAYFETRPPGSRLGAAASLQSEVLDSRRTLEERVERLRAELGGAGPPLPEHWGGYVVSPDAWEFWQHRDDRLHDRFRYLPEPGGGWLIERLYP